MKTLVLVLDLAGTFVFALSGAMAAVRHRLDIFGILVVSFAAATFGGMGRDLLIGAVPPAAIEDWRYVATSALAGLAIFYWTPKKLGTPLLIFDGAGLAFFAVSGSLKACAWGAPPVAAVLLGALTGVGGGMARDILVSEIPTVLRADLYAVAALAGAAVVVGGILLKLPFGLVTGAGLILCFGLRFIAIRRGWHLPTARWPEEIRRPMAAPTGRPGEPRDGKFKRPNE
ncbi:MAG TPA: trimeric intracellular cation channel family protein [Chthoniobacterales bacterium]